MVLFFVINTFLFILLVTQCCGMTVSKRQDVTRRIEGLFGIPERPSIQLEEVSSEEEDDEDNEDEQITEVEKNRQIEESRKIIEAIKQDLDKKMD